MVVPRVVPRYSLLQGKLHSCTRYHALRVPQIAVSSTKFTVLRVPIGTAVPYGNGTGTNMRYGVYRYIQYMAVCGMWIKKLRPYR
jgi:hypothetical protein